MINETSANYTKDLEEWKAARNKKVWFFFSSLLVLTENLSGLMKPKSLIFGILLFRELSFFVLSICCFDTVWWCSWDSFIPFMG